MARRVRVVVQARLTSRRLPGKAMLSLGSRPMVVLAALRAGNAGGEVVVATSDESDDDVIARAVEDAGIGVIRGSLDDPLRRIALAADDLADEDIVVRLTADNVVPDGALVDWLVSARDQAGVDYARFGGDDPALPYGVAAEVFGVGLLRAADRDATGAAHREHVTGWMRERDGDHRLAVPEASDRDWSGRRCTVDSFDDYVALCAVFAGIDDAVGAPWWQISDRLPTRLAPPEAASGNPIGQGRLVLGSVQLGAVYGAANLAGMPDDRTARRILLGAVDLGITHVDTARAYGDSEARIGRALSRGLAEHLRVVTKVRPLDDVPTTADAAWGRAATSESLQRSLRLIGSERVDAVLVHRAADWSRPGVRDALVACVDDGVATLVGASLSDPAELAPLLADPRCGYVQLPFNLLDRRWTTPAVEQALAARPDVVVTVRSVFLQGLLVGGRAARWPATSGVDPTVVNATVDDLVAQLARSSSADLCLAYVLGHPWVTSVVVGVDTPEHLVEVATLTRNPPLDVAERAVVEAALPAGDGDLVDPSRWTS